MALPAVASQIPNTKGRAVLHEEAMRVEASRLAANYEVHEFTVPSPTTAVSIKTVVNHATSCSCGRASGPFAIVPRAQSVKVQNRARVGNPVVSFLFNATTGDPWTSDTSTENDWLEILTTDVFVTNQSGVGVPVRVILA